MHYIIGDIGNTSTRICLFNQSRIIKSIIINTKNIFLKGYIKKNIQKNKQKKFEKDILFSCVVPSVLKKIKKDLNGTGYKVFEIKNFNLNKIIKINIQNVKQLGSDRIVNSIEGKKFRNCLVNRLWNCNYFRYYKKWNIRGRSYCSWCQIIYTKFKSGYSLTSNV